MMFTFLPVQLYLVDSFEYAASALVSHLPSPFVLAELTYLVYLKAAASGRHDPITFRFSAYEIVISIVTRALFGFAFPLFARVFVS